MTTADHRPVSHTPGPWRAAFSPGWEPRRDESDEEICCLPHMSFDAVDIFGPKRKIGPNNCSWEEFEANARLIAAAPEMLSSLRELLDIITEHDKLQYPKGSPIDRTVTRARQIIAKAEGKP